MTKSAAPSQFPPHVLREYALLADGERGAVVGPRGDIVWMCAPGWADDAVFSALVGGPGLYAVTPADASYVWGGSYRDGSMVWRGRWVSTERLVECQEALALPADPARAVMLRRIQAHEGGADIEVRLDPRAGFGKHRLTQLQRDGDTWTGRCGPLRVRWSGAPDAVKTEQGLVARVRLPPGASHDLVLEISAEELPADSVRPDQAWRRTEDTWHDLVPALDSTIADRDARHAYAVLRGLTSKRGGMVAAATMSLPERAEAGRNYDYRYSWIRDQCYAGQAAAAVGDDALLDEAAGFVTARLLEDGDQLKPAYCIGGGAVPDERELDLPGYPGGTDKVGNWVNKQFQLDVFGEALLLLATAGRADHLDAERWRAVETAVLAIESRRGDREAGIWEIDDERWTQSRLICVAGLKAVVRLAPAAQASGWQELADRIVVETAADSLHPSGRWQRSPGDPRVDAALLIPTVRGAVAADDPRADATLRAVIEELGRDHFMYRFRHDDRPLHEAEGAFLLCGFFTAMALHQRGETVEAMRWFERNRAACGPPGLLTEEFDVVQRQLRGNLPQAFVHALLLESAQRLADPW